MDGFKIFVHVLGGLLVIFGILVMIFALLFIYYAWIPECKQNAEERENRKKSIETLTGLTFGVPPYDAQTV